MPIESMERQGHLRLDPVVRSLLLDVSAATIDRLLRPVREATGRGRRRRWGIGSAIKQSVAVVREQTCQPAIYAQQGA
jgi:hypothetical protein